MVRNYLRCYYVDLSNYHKQSFIITVLPGFSEKYAKICLAAEHVGAKPQHQAGSHQQP